MCGKTEVSKLTPLPPRRHVEFRKMASDFRFVTNFENIIFRFWGTQKGQETKIFRKKGRFWAFFSHFWQHYVHFEYISGSFEYTIPSFYYYLYILVHKIAFLHLYLSSACCLAHKQTSSVQQTYTQKSHKHTYIHTYIS